MDGPGRPRLYDDPESFAQKADDYFAFVEEAGKRPTVSGLSYYMGFEDRDGFSNYASYGPDYSRTVKRAKLRMEDDRTQALIDKGTFTPGQIFDLKNNFGWKDKTEQELSGPDGGPVQVQKIERVIVE